ncbi:MAG: helix-turn-helix domain-containing protein [Oscillospiraceae bacterium]|nr:helix-turn-helix domain-containing protein [Oscillospiraceae bacterium]
MTWFDLLVQLKATSGLTIGEIADKADAPKSTVSKIMSGHAPNPSVDVLTRIVYAMGGTLDDIDPKSNTKGPIFTSTELELIKKYRTLDGYGKKMVDMILELEIQRLADQAAEDELAPNVIELPLFDQPASAGYGNWLDETISEPIPVPDTPTTRRADFCIRVSGDSMEPKYADGDLVFVRKQDDVSVGEFGIWVIDGSAYIKQRAANSLHSLNPEYDDVEQGENVFCVGKVIGKL